MENTKNKYEHSLVFPREYVALDLEATSNANYNFLIEISAYKIKNGIVVDSFNTIVKPPIYRRFKYKRSKVSSFIMHKEEKIYYVDAFIEKLTGIDNNMIYNGLDERLVIKKLEKFIGKLPIIGHGLNNDLALIDSAYKRILRRPLENAFVDTFIVGLFLDNTEYSLSKLCEKYSIVNENIHRAFSDSMCTYLCYEELIKEIESKFASNKEIYFEEWLNDRKFKAIKILKNKTLKNINNKNWFHLLLDLKSDNIPIDKIINKNIFFDTRLKNFDYKTIKPVLKRLNCTVNRKIGQHTNFFICNTKYIDINNENVQQIIRINKSGKKIKILDINIFLSILSKLNEVDLDINRYTDNVVHSKESIVTDKKPTSLENSDLLSNDNNLDLFIDKRIYFYNKLQDVCTADYIKILEDNNAIIETTLSENTDIVIVGESKEKDIFIESPQCDQLIYYLSLGYDIKVLNEQYFLNFFKTTIL